MSEEEKFDELLSSKLSERDFPFDELNWDEAERLIIQQERWKKIFRFIFIFSVGLVVGIAIMLPFIINTHNVLPNPLVTQSTTTANQNQVAQNSVSEPAKPSQVNTNNANSNEKKSPLPVQSALVKKDTRTGRGTSYNVSPITKALVDKQSVGITGASKILVKASMGVSANEMSKKSEHSEPISHKEINATEQVTNVSSAQATNNVIAGNTTTVNNANKADKNNSTNTTETANIVSNSNTVSSNSTLPNDTNKSSKNSVTNSVAKNNITAPYDTASSSTKNYSNNANSPPMLRVDQPVSNSNYSQNILSVYTGGNYSLGWGDADNGEKQANGITPWGGFDFTHYFTNDIAASIGIGYSEINHLNETYTSSIIQYDFGANSSITTVTPQTAYYIAFPVSLKYNIDDKDKIGIGCDYLLLMTTSSILNTYQQSYFSQTASTTEKQNGYTQGFSNTDIELTLSYTRMITDRLGISIDFYHDLGYIENGSIPGTNQPTKNNGLRLVLSYQLMK
jgi:hypothetical protein